MMDKQPAEVFHPGVHLRNEMEARGWSTCELAQRGGFDAEYLFNLKNGKASINNLTSQMLGIVFGTSAEFWLNLQKQWDEHVSTSRG
jgi:plasmid maintenance system antidote protein VapI